MEKAIAFDRGYGYSAPPDLINLLIIGCNSRPRNLSVKIKKAIAHHGVGVVVTAIDTGGAVSRSPL